MNLHPEILNQQQKYLTERLGVLNDFSAYLAGGTALALQLGHRTSRDFDFYTPTKFKPEVISEKLKNAGLEIPTDGTSEDNTYQTIIEGVSLSIFHYPYKLVGGLLEFPPIKLALLEDIAAMKIVAVIQRAKQRDFFDLYYLIQNLGLEKILTATYQKYPWYQENNQIIFKSLVYFEEAENDTEINRVKIFDERLTWEKVKKEINLAVEEHLET